MRHDTVGITSLTLEYLVHEVQKKGRDDNSPLPAAYTIAEMRARYPLFEYIFENVAECNAIVGPVIQHELPQLIGTIENLIESKLPPEFEFELDSTRHLQACALEIFAQIPLERMAEVTDSQDFDPIAKRFALNLKNRHHLDMRRISRLANAYREAVREPWHQPRLKLSLIDTVANYAHLRRAEHDTVIPQEETSSLPIRWYSADGIFPNRKVKIGIVAINAEHSAAKQLDDFEKLSTSARADLLVIIAVGTSTGFAPEIRAHLSRDDTVCLSEERLKTIGLAENPERVFRDTLLMGLPLRRLSPFKFGSPTE
jgi:hypothetical protein